MYVPDCNGRSIMLHRDSTVGRRPESLCARTQLHASANTEQENPQIYNFIPPTKRKIIHHLPTIADEESFHSLFQQLLSPLQAQTKGFSRCSTSHEIAHQGYL